MPRDCFLLKDTEVAKEFGIPRSTLCKKRLTGDGPPFVKIGSAVYYERAIIVKWIAERRVRSTSEFRS